jgi:hypothetical protein
MGRPRSSARTWRHRFSSHPEGEELVELAVLALLTIVGLSVLAIVGFVFVVIKLVFWIVFLPFRLLFHLLWIPFGLVFGALGATFAAVIVPVVLMVGFVVAALAIIGTILGLLIPAIPFVLLGLLIWSLGKTPAVVA